MVEHPNDLRRLVRNDFLLLLVVECGNSKTAAIVLVVGKINVPEMRELCMKWIWCRVFARLVLIFGSKSPPFLAHMPVD